MKKILLVVSFCLSTYSYCCAQEFWHMINGPYSGKVNDMVVLNNNIMVATDNGIFESNVLTSGNWRQMALSGENVVKIVWLDNSGKKLIAGVNFSSSLYWGMKIYMSFDYGFSWKLVKTIYNQATVGFTSDTLGYIYAVYSSQGGGILRTTDYGSTWETVLIIPNYFTCIGCSSTGSIFAVVNDGSIYKSSDNGKNWVIVNSTSPISGITTLATYQDKVFVGTSGGLVYRTTNDGLTWQNTSTGLEGSSISSLVSDIDNYIWTASQSGIFVSLDKGLNWKKVNSTTGKLFAASNSQIVIVVNDFGVYNLSNHGNDFTEITIPIRLSNVKCILSNSNDCLFTSIDKKIMRSTDGGQSWHVNLVTYFPISSFAKNPNGITYVVGGAGDAVFGFNEIFYSSNNGVTWNYINTDSYVFPLNIITINKQNNIYITCNGRGVYKLLNNSTLIQASNEGLTNKTILSLIALSKDTLLAGTDGGGIYVSFNQGDNWIQSNTGLTSMWITSLAVNSHGTLFAGSNFQGGVFRSADQGNTWVALGPSNESIVCLAVNSSDKIFAGTESEGVFCSTDDGETWTKENSGLTNENIQILSLDNNGFIYAGTKQGIFKSTKSTITAINETDSKLPLNFSLQQNYPNPFNPTTTIKYSISQTSFVTLKVFDLLGKEVATLVNGEKNPGNYKVDFYANGISSGVYFYRLKAGNFVTTKKLVLLK